MRKIILSGTATLVLAFGAASANAIPLSGAGSPYVLIDQQQAQPRHGSSASAVQEGRAVSIGESFSARYTDGAAHDSAFSPQQDEIYNGRF
jgi:hypothetical protein